jgi:hypothetical protein
MIFLFKLFNSEFIVMNNIHLGELMRFPQTWLLMLVMRILLTILQISPRAWRVDRRMMDVALYLFSSSSNDTRSLLYCSCFLCPVSLSVQVLSVCLAVLAVEFRLVHHQLGGLCLQLQPRIPPDDTPHNIPIPIVPNPIDNHHTRPSISNGKLPRPFP